MDIWSVIANHMATYMLYRLLHDMNGNRLQQLIINLDNCEYCRGIWSLSADSCHSWPYKHTVHACTVHALQWVPCLSSWHRSADWNRARHLNTVTAVRVDVCTVNILYNVALPKPPWLQLITLDALAIHTDKYAYALPWQIQGKRLLPQTCVCPYQL